jgi:hypothetical protein
MPGSVEIEFAERGAVAVLADGVRLTVDAPLRLDLLGGEPVAGGYGTVREDGSGWLAAGRLEAADGTVVVCEDRWRVVDPHTVQVDRVARVATAGSAAGVRVELVVATGAPLDDCELFIPGALYNRNDTDHDGIEDYLGTYVQDHRDDRLASLAVMGFLAGRGRSVALTRADVPEHDGAIAPADLLRRRFVQETDIGSLGLAPDDAGQLCLRASHPFSEEYSYCLNTDRDGWAAYAPNRPGVELSASYQLRIAAAGSLTDAIWDLTRHQMAVLGTAPSRPAFTLEESLQHRVALTQQYYREWDATPEGHEPAGYMVHFSPRSGRTLGTLLEYGFSGAQTLLALTAIEHGYRDGVPLWIERARRVNQFFVDHCQLESGFSHGMYDPARDAFAYWFTGVLMPFQYASDPATLRRYLGAQVTAALTPIAEALRPVRGNYTRTMCESVYPLLLAYGIEARHGHVHESWRRAGERFGRFLLATQAADGSWHRAYDTQGTPLTSPATWFGATDTERKSGTIFPVAVLVQLHRVTGDERYLEAAVRAGDFIVRTYVDRVEYIGGLNDTTHIKSVKTDSVGVMFAMRSLVKLFDATGERRFLDGAASAARVLASWVYLWDVPFPAGTLLARSGLSTRGWAVCDVIPGGSYLDNELLEFTGDLVRVAELTGDERLFDVAELVEYGMQGALSTPHDMLGYVAPGIQCEGIMTGYWMSDPDTTEFSGAVNKVKGDDNDTCNGLTNGQAAYALFELHDRYGTFDFDVIRQRLFGATAAPSAA